MQADRRNSEPRLTLCPLAAQFSRWSIPKLIVAIVFLTVLHGGGRGAVQGQELAIATIQEDPAPWRTGSVTGRVLDQPGGAGVGGVTVELCPHSGAGPAAATVTRADGSYEFTHLMPAAYLIRARHPRPGHGVEAVEARVLMNAVQADDLTLALPQSFSGIVREYDSGKPVEGVQIQFEMPGGDWDFIQTDAEGRFRIAAQPRKMQIYCRGKAGELSPCDPRGEVNEAACGQLVSLVANEKNHQLDFFVRPAPVFRGRVVMPDGGPAVGAKVSGDLCLLRVSEEQRAALTLRHSGTVDFLWQNVPQEILMLQSFIPDHSFTAKTEENGWYSANMDFELGESAHNSSRVLCIQQVTAQLADKSLAGVTTANELAIKLAPTGSVKFRVMDEQGQPVDGVELRFKPFTRFLTRPTFSRDDVTGQLLMSGCIPGVGYQLSLGDVRVSIEGVPDPPSRNLERRYGIKAFELAAGEVRDLGDWGPRKKTRSPEKILAGLSGNDREEFGVAMGELDFLAEEGAFAVKELVKILRSAEEMDDRARAASVLGAIGPAANSAVPVLMGLCRSQDGRMPKSYLLEALGKIRDPKSLDLLEDYANSQDDNVARAAVNGLGQFPARDAVPRLVNCLARGTLAPEAACQNLTKYQEASSAAVPELLRLLGKNPDVCLAALETLAATRDPSALPGLEDFAKGVGNRGGYLFSAAAFAIDQIHAAKHERR